MLKRLLAHHSVFLSSVSVMLLKVPFCLDTPPSFSQCLVLGAGPCGLRTAIELSLLGAQVVVLEKRETFSRNNVLHLWPYTIYDLRGLGAKKFYGKFCSGSLDHISESHRPLYQEPEAALQELPHL